MDASYDVVVVGAGIAGSALAFALGVDGRRVHLIERDLKEPDRMVGEILQPGGYLKLCDLGLSDCVKYIDAQELAGYVAHKDGETVAVQYPLENYNRDITGRAFHHGRFVQKLRQKAASLPSVNVEQGNVTFLIEENEEIKGVRYRTRTGHESKTFAPLTVVCDGGFSNLRKSLSKPKTEQRSYCVGVILENCQIPNPNFAHLIFEDPISAFYPISSTEFRFSTTIPGPKVPSISSGEMARYLKTVVAPRVPTEMYSAFASSIDKGDMRVMPLRNMPSVPCLKRGAIMIGDALSMRNPITAAGMTVALHDVALLSNLVRHLNLHDSNALAKCIRKFYKTRKPMAFTMNVMANFLYAIFHECPDKSRKIIQQACFDCIHLGRSFSRAGMELVAGLNPCLSKMILNSLGLALYTVGSIILVPSPKRLYAAARLMLDVASIIVPIILKEM